MPKIAILITYYNEKELLTECLNSVFAQTFPVDEIIVYDDCSSFPATNYIPPNLPVKVIRGEENRGPGFGRNQLLNISQSDYIHFQDADDLFKPTWCEKVRNAIETTKADIILTEISAFVNGELATEKVLDLARLNHMNDLTKFALQGSILPAATTIKRNIALQLGGYRTREILPQSEDFDFHIRLAATGVSYTNILEPLIIQRIRENSHSQDKKLCHTSALDSMKLLAKELSPKYKNDLIENITRISSILYHIGGIAEAKIGFQLALSLGKPKFIFHQRFYRLIASLFGQEFAEQIGSLYRKILPDYWRKKIREI